MISITLPDNTIKRFDTPPSAMDVATTLSEGFARNCVAVEVDGELKDLSHTFTTDAAVVFLTTKDEKSIEVLRHTAAHVMAQAILRLYPEARLAIGPVVENGFYYDIDMPPISEDAFKKIEDEMRKVVNAKFPIVRKEIPKAEALSACTDEPYKTELIENLDDGTITFYEQGEFSDLCRGPHLPHTGMVKAFKLMRVSGAYWRADPSRQQLQRIYGTAFFDKKELKAYLTLLEEARKRDHRKIGSELGLFSFHDEAPGMPFFHPNGMVIWNELLQYWREAHQAADYVEIKTPVMMTRTLWEKSGHWENYRENMYTSEVDEMDYAIKPMNCPGGMLLYGETNHSYRELPLRAGEIGLVHRHELSGALSGLFRVRAFHQDDAHIFMMPEQIEQEILGVLQLVEQLYSTFGLGFHLELSTRPEKSIGSDAQWDTATNGLTAALETYGKPYQINEGDGAFYGPKIDIHIKDAIGRTWQCGTIQLDMALPERFDLTYIGADNERHRPVMIHRVIYGSIERFFGILVEHFAGKFPLWLAPTQAILLPINDDLVLHAETVKRTLDAAGIRTRVDDRSESLKKKIREAQLQRICMMITLGEKEKTEGTLSIRTLDGSVHQGVTIEKLLDVVQPLIKQRSLDMTLSF
ncbi:MAG: threonine--tRNA ligase [Deltaproteobacteria bacterium]|nr:MAG: threonine--tRNA ligase [Deltaproteobacteria bacterium]